MRTLTALVFLIPPLLAGCIVVREEPPRRYAPAPAPVPATDADAVAPAPEPTAEEEQVNYVVYREYFGASEDEIAYIPHYRRYYGISDDDLYFLWFTSRLAGIAFDVCFNSYWHHCGRSYDRLVLYYRVPRERYFVTIGAGASYPPMYARTYGAYHSGSYASVTFSNREWVSLVHMKVGCEYQGHPPTTYFARVQASGSTNRVLIESRDKCGSGGRTATGASVQVTATRAWTLPPQQREQFQQQHQVRATQVEVKFKDVHKEQVTKVERQAPTKPGPAARTPEPDKTPAAAKPPAAPEHPERARTQGPPPAAERAPASKPGPQVEHPPGKQPPVTERTPNPKPPPQVERAPAREPAPHPAPEKPKSSEKPKNDDKGKDKDKDKK